MQYCWPAKELRNEFEVLASFYQLDVGHETFLCRNHAYIKREGEQGRKSPDALIIMANPGSCRPADSTYKAPTAKSNTNNIPYVPVDVDPTQYQLMRLMKIMDWEEISIINLSDLCSGNMNDFKRKLKQVKDYGIKCHSIFSETRTREKMRHFKNHHLKVILAWGKDPSIKSLANHALNLIPDDTKIYGLRFPNESWAFRHPNPLIKDRCISWLKEMHELLINESQ